MAMNYLRLQVLILMLFTTREGVHTRFVHSLDLLTGGNACEVWISRDYVSTLHFAAYIRRAVRLLQEVELYAQAWECI